MEIRGLFITQLSVSLWTGENLLLQKSEGMRE